VEVWRLLLVGASEYYTYHRELAELAAATRCDWSARPVATFSSAMAALASARAVFICSLRFAIMFSAAWNLATACVTAWLRYVCRSMAKLSLRVLRCE